MSGAGERKKTPIWSWRQAIAEANVPTGTKALCWALALDLSDCGRYTVVPVEEIARMTSMSLRSVNVHAQAAKDAGLIAIERIRDKGGHVIGTRYYPRFPDNVELAKSQAESLSAESALRDKTSDYDKSLNADSASLNADSALSIKKPFLRTFPQKKEVPNKQEKAVTGKTTVTVETQRNEGPNKPEEAYSAPRPKDSASPVKEAAASQPSAPAAGLKTAASRPKAPAARKVRQAELIPDADMRSEAMEAERKLDDEALTLFNEAANRVGILPALRLTSQRREALRQLRRTGLDWRKGFGKLAAAKFPTKSGWMPRDFDAVIREQFFTQLLEGQFDPPGESGSVVNLGDAKREHWRRILTIYVRNGRRTWVDTLGPRPGEPGCLVPADILAEFPRAMPPSAESDSMPPRGEKSKP